MTGPTHTTRLDLIKVVGYFVAAAGAVMVVAAGNHAGGPEGVFNPFTLLGFLPSLVLVVAMAITRLSGAALTVLAGSAAVIGWGVRAYLLTVFAEHPSSTVGLVFLFIPFYQMVGSMLVLVVSAVWRACSQKTFEASHS